MGKDRRDHSDTTINGEWWAVPIHSVSGWSKWKQLHFIWRYNIHYPWKRPSYAPQSLPSDPSVDDWHGICHRGHHQWTQCTDSGKSCAYQRYYRLHETTTYGQPKRFFVGWCYRICHSVLRLPARWNHKDVRGIRPSLQGGCHYGIYVWVLWRKKQRCERRWRDFIKGPTSHPQGLKSWRSPARTIQIWIDHCRNTRNRNRASSWDHRKYLYNCGRTDNPNTRELEPDAFYDGFRFHWLWRRWSFYLAVGIAWRLR